MTLTLERAMEAWLFTGGKWGLMLDYLAGRHKDGALYFSRADEKGRHFYCRLCKVRIASKSSTAILPAQKAIKAHMQAHLDELKELLKDNAR